MSKSIKGLRKAGLASLAVTLTLGAGIAAAGSASALPGFEFERVDGKDRYVVSAKTAEKFGAASSVLLASGESGKFGDALTASYLAGDRKAPVMLTELDKTPQVILDAINKLGATKITIVGGPLSVSEAQEQALKDKGYTVDRLHGRTRFDTAAAVIKAGGDRGSDTALVATGEKFPDALSAGPVSYGVGMPIGTVALNDAPDAVIDALKSVGITKAVVLGGNLSVGAEPRAELKAKGIDIIEEFAGKTRGAVSQQVAEYALSKGFNSSRVNVASGRAFSEGADALGGGALSGEQKRPILITDGEDVVGPYVLDYLRDHSNTLTGKDNLLFGGLLSIGQGEENQMESAAQGDGTNPNPSNRTVTDRPELVNAQILETNASGPNAGTRVRYTFDENVTGKTPDETKFHAYMYDGTKYSAAEAIVDPTNNKAILARFTAITTVKETTTAGLQGAENLRVATVDADAVRDDTASSTGSDAANPIGDAQLAAGSETSGGSTGFKAGVTAAPDLVSVSGITQVPGQNRTVVTFNFDEAATLVNFTASDGNNDGFHLVLQDGATDLEGQVQNGNGTSSIEVVFDSTGTGGLTAANIARGYVESQVVSDDADDSTIDDAATPADPAQGHLNPLQAAEVGNSGNSASPDLVSATLGAYKKDTAAADNYDYIDYKFDEAVTALVDSNMFYAYDAEGSMISTGSASAAVRSTSDNTVVRVFFEDESLMRAVGASVDQAAVQADDGAPLVNQEDEVGVANGNTDSTSGSSTVRTDGPDLNGVTVTADKDIFGTPTGTYTATYSFDEQLEAPFNDANAPAFALVLGNGDIIQAESCEVDIAGTPAAPTNTVTCDDFTGSVGQPNQAVLGTVNDGAVDDYEAGSNTNPEGAEVVSGATAGSPQS